MPSRKPSSLLLGFALVVGAGLGTLLWGGCQPGSGGGAASGDDGFLDATLIAEVGEYKITARDLDDRLRYQFPDLHGVYSATAERSIREVLGVDLDHLSLIAEAERLGYPDSSRRFRQNMEVARRQILQRDFVEDIIHAAARPSQAELERIYEERKQQFRRPARAVVRHILVPTADAARKAKARIDAGESFAEVATQLTTHEPSRRSGGALGFVEAGRPVQGLGEVPELATAALSMPEGQTDIVKTNLGWHVILVDRQVPEGFVPFSEVREQLSESLFRTRGTMALDSTLKALRVRFGTRLNDEALTAYMSWRRAGPESSVFEQAQNEPDPEKRLAIYEDYVKHYGHSEHACQARFLIGFTLAEELKDRTRAVPKLREFIEACPQSDLVDDAQAIIDGLTQRPQ